jgi:hypothetical protein
VLDQVLARAFLDELEKIAVARAQLTVPQSRQGRRPISVDNYLKRDRAGTLFRGVQKSQGQVPARDGNEAWAGPGANIQDGREFGALVPAGMVISNSDSGPMPRY